MVSLLSYQEHFLQDESNDRNNFMMGIEKEFNKLQNQLIWKKELS